MLWSLARAGIGIGVRGPLLWRVVLAARGRVLARAHVCWVAGVVIFTHIGILVSVLKWRWLLRAVGTEAGVGTLFGLYLIGTFFNNFAPSMVGGDAIRAYMLGKETGDTSQVAATTVLERLTGLAALVCLVPLGLLDPQIREPYPWIVPVVAGVALAFLCGTLAAIRYRAIPGVVGLLERIPKNRVTGFVSRTERNIAKFKGNQTVLLLCFVASFVFYALAMLAVYSGLTSIGVEISARALVIIVPLVMLIGLLPISMNGIGVNEICWVIFLGAFGVPEVSAVALGLILRARSVFTSALGGLLYALARRRVTGEPGKPGALESEPT